MQRSAQLDMTIFTVDNIEFGWEEIIAAAKFWGEMEELLSKVRCGLVLKNQAAERGEDPSAAELQAALQAFRYQRNLVSGQEAQNWLSEWDLTVEEWKDYFRRDLLRQRGDRAIEKKVEQAQLPEHEVRRAFRTEALCSGRFAGWARKLAGRAAFAARLGERQEAAESKAAWIERIDAIYEKCSVEAVNSERIAAQIQDHRIEWMRFDCRYVWFPEERIAREAAHCVTADGLSLDEVAYDSRSVVQQWNFYLDEIEAPVRPHFLAARAGDWLGPVRMMEGFPLFAIEGKRLPTSEDPRIRERAEAMILHSMVEQEINHRVKWILQL